MRAVGSADVPRLGGHRAPIGIALAVADGATSRLAIVADRGTSRLVIANARRQSRWPRRSEPARD